ncbi:MAG TPA: hypothetical protein VGG64_17450 [Pirellulales bacterium]|jgi:hypothetical protein
MRQISFSDSLLQLLDHHNFLPAAGMLVGVVAIVAMTTAIIVVTKLVLSHRQRIAMIARGIHPDALYTEMIEEPTSSPGARPTALPNHGES